MASLIDIIESLENRGFDMGFTRGVTGQQNKQAGYPTGQRIAGETAKKMLLERGPQLPTTADIFGEVPDQYFEPDTKLGEGINQLLRGAAKAGQFTSDALVRAPLQSILNVGRMYDKAGKGIGQYAALPTDRKQASVAGEIDQFKRAGIRRNLSPALGIDDELSQLSAALAKKSIPRQTQAEREEMELGEGEAIKENFVSPDIPLMTEAELAEMEQDEISQLSSGAKSTTSATTDGGSESSNANQTAQVGAAGTGAGTGDAGGKTDEPYNPYGALLESAMKDVTALQGKDPDALTKEDYMREFAEATGVNISGEPDKSHALMAFGLALMQNKAGKGFNVSKMLGAVGEAGEKAMPAFQKAKEVARAERIAAGKYALSERKAAAASRLSQLNAAQERVQDLLTKTSDHVSKQLLNQQEHELDMAKVKLENIGKVDAARAKTGGKQFDVTAAGTYAPLTSMPNIKINTAVRKSDGQEVFTKPLQDVELLAKGYADTLDGISSVDNISTLIDDAAKASAAGVTGQRFFEFIDGRMKALGFEEGLGVGVTVDGKKLGPLAEADAIRKRLIFQYKRFLTQETGNGISNVDIQNLEAAIGNIDFFTNPQEALVKLRETRKLFEMSRDTLQRQLVRFSDKDLYLAPSQFDKVQQKINSAALSGVGMGRGNLDVSETDDGVTVIKLS